MSRKSHTTLKSVLSCAFSDVVSSALLLSLPLLVMVLGAAVSVESAVVVGSLLDNDDDDDDEDEEEVEVPELTGLGSVAVRAAARFRISFSFKAVVLESVVAKALSSSSSSLLGGNVGSEMLTLRPPSLESFFSLSALSSLSSSSSNSASKSSSVVPRLLAPPPAPPPRPLRSRIGPMVRNK